jgi:hypothetical protein
MHDHDHSLDFISFLIYLSSPGLYNSYMPEERHKGRFLVTIIVLLVGIALGVFGILRGREYIEPYIPSLKPLDKTPVQGIVVKKLKNGTKLLMTLDTTEGALLATFTHKVDEIDLLVNEGDHLEFSLLKYKPFITDPVIHRVRKEGSLSTLQPKEKETGQEEPKKSVVKQNRKKEKPSPKQSKSITTSKKKPLKASPKTTKKSADTAKSQPETKKSVDTTAPSPQQGEAGTTPESSELEQKEKPAAQ